MSKRGKKGFSKVVTIIIFILLVLAAAATIWVVITKFLYKADKINIKEFSVLLSIDSAEVQLIDSNGNPCVIEDCTNVSLKISRETGGGEMDSILFIISDNSSTYEEVVEISLEELSEKTFSISIGDLNASLLREIIVIPFFKGRKGESFSSALSPQYNFQTEEVDYVNTAGTSSPSSSGGGGGDSYGGGGGGGGDGYVEILPSTCKQCTDCDTLFSSCYYSECRPCGTGTCYYKGVVLGDNCVEASTVCGTNIIQCSDYSDEECVSDVCGLGNCKFDRSSCVTNIAEPICGDGICNNNESIASCVQDCNPYNGDSMLYLSDGGYALGSNVNGTDLDYTKSFSVEAISKIDPHKTGARHSSFIQKGDRNVVWRVQSIGFGMGIYYNSLSGFGKQIIANIADGSNRVNLISDYYEGYVYSVMTWDVLTKTLTLYVNGERFRNTTNEDINVSNLVNNFGFQIGRGEGELKKDVFMARIWNRKLSEIEVTDLWNNYQSTGQHELPNGFSISDLFSEWLMQETSYESGLPGDTHIKDTAGINHLELLGNAKIYSGSGSLTLDFPSNGAVGVNKAVTLKASGGINTLGGNVIKPLKYYFQIDEVNSFDSVNLKESDWLLHYNQWEPLLKPDTKYYWRVKVKDSGGSTGSAYTPVYSFTTEGATNWWVRDPLGNYGLEDGTSYNNAWNDIRDVIWGENGVEAGDDLYVCGTHVVQDMTKFFGNTYTEYVEVSGYSQEYPITIRMDCPNDKGVMWGIGKDNIGGIAQWTGPDANGVYSTNDFSLNRYGTPGIEFNGVDYIWLNNSGENTWVGNNGARFYNKSEGTNYLKTTDGSDPTGKIYSSSMTQWYTFNLGRSSYIKFLNCNFINSVQVKERKITTITDVPVSHHITYDGCDLQRGGTLIDIYSGHDFFTIRNSKLHNAGNGIYTRTPGNMYNLLVENNEFYDIRAHKDAHGVGVQNGINFIIQNNTFYNTGAAMEFWSGNYDMKNNTIRYNFIRDVYDQSNTNGGGIVISGNTAPEKRHSYFIYGNIILRPAQNTYEDFQGGGITVNIGGDADLHIYNNIIYDEGGNHTNGRGAIRAYNIQALPLKNVFIYNNIISYPNYRYLYLRASGSPWENVYLDNNIYYPTTDFSAFLLGELTNHNSNSIFADPLFVSADPQKREDFRLQAGSPAIDAGFDVGLPYSGSAPDIGAIEF